MCPLFGRQLAKAGCRCDYALYVGAASDNAAILPAVSSQTAGLKMYLNDTYSTLKMDNVSLWMEVGQALILGETLFFVVETVKFSLLNEQSFRLDS